MTDIYLKIVNMSISASWIVPAVLLLRLILKKAPKWITVLLWGIVAVRLICPFSIESVLSLIPNAETVSPGIMMDITPEIDTGVPVINNSLNPIITGSFTPDPFGVNPLQILIPISAIIWIAGMLVLLAYTVLSRWRLQRKIGTAVLLRDNIFQSENIATPFVLGIIMPKIYLPYHISDRDAAHVIAHEQAHISRKDHLWKPFGFLLLTLHWFNPLMWLGYVLLCRDIELACDEKVISKLDRDEKADYSQALLACSVGRRMISACPLAFGEVGVKSRVKSVLNYKKPALWIAAAAVALCVALAACTLTDPISTSIDPAEDSTYSNGPSTDPAETSIYSDEISIDPAGIIYEDILSCYKTTIMEDGCIEDVIYDFAEEGRGRILAILNNGKWTAGMADCDCDIKFVTEKGRIGYHSECGTFIDTTHGRSFTLLAEDKTEFNKLFAWE